LTVNADSISVLADSLIMPFHHVAQDAVEKISFRADIAYQLYQILVEPVEKMVSLPNKILIVTDQALLKLPFEMLLTARPEKLQYRPTDLPDYQDHFLLHKYSFAYAPSIYFLNSKPPSVKGQAKFLLFANPVQSVTVADKNYRYVAAIFSAAQCRC